MTSLLASLLGQARIYVVLGREGLLPPGLAQLHPRRATPVRATWLTGASAGTLATGGWTIMGLLPSLAFASACCACLHNLRRSTSSGKMGLCLCIGLGSIGLGSRLILVGHC